MAILRAGPFASSIDSFLNQPIIPTVGILPVNCAMNNWEGDSWMAAKTIEYEFEGDESESSEGEESDEPSEGEDTESTGDPYENTTTYENGPDISASFEDRDGAYLSAALLQFRYQAAVATTFTLTYSADGDSPGISVFVGGNLVYGDGGNSSISGTEVITLPAKVLPSIVKVDLGTFGSGTGTITIS
jgi:hypothetical protein